MGRILLGSQFSPDWKPDGQLRLKDHPLNDGLLYHFLHNEGVGKTKDLISGQEAIATAPWSMSERGPTLKYDGSSDYSQASINLSSTNRITLAFWLYWNAFANDDKLAMEHSVNTNNNDNAFFIDPNESVSGKFAVHIYKTNRNETVVDRPSAGAWHHYVISIDKSVNLSRAVQLITIDGVVQTLSGSAWTGDVSGNFGNYDMYFMSRAGTSLYGAGKQDDIRIWNRLLSAQEALDLYIDPHQTLESETQRIWVPVSAAGADLAAAAVGVATGSAQLTTQIPLAAAGVSVATGTGALSTAIPLAGNAASVSIASGVLTAQIKFEANALAQALATAALTSGIPLSAAAIATASGSGDLVTQIRLAAAALAAASATGDLSAPGSGLNAAALASASGSAALTAMIRMAATATANAQASAALSTGIPLSAAAAALASGSGGITTQILLSGQALSTALATAALDSGIRLAASGSAQASGSANLSTQIPILAAALSAANAAGDLSTGIPLQATAVSVSTGSGVLSTSITFSAAALAQALATGSLTAQIKLNAAALAQAVASGELVGAVLPASPAARVLRLPIERRQFRMPRERRELRL